MPATHSTSRRGVIAVTGACGFIGANAVLHLVRCGHGVLAADLTPPPDPLRNAWLQYPGLVRWISLDVTAQEAWAALDEEPVDAIIHGAAVTTGLAETIARVNLWGTIAALEYARRRGCRRFVFISSSAVYGNVFSPTPVPETGAVRPVNPYGVSKLSAEHYVSLYRRTHGLDACSVRLAAAHGPWERPTGTRTRMSPFFLLARAALRRQRIRVAGLEVARDWIYAEDVAAGLAHLAELPALPHDVFNLSTGNVVNLGEIVRTLKRLLPEAAIEVSSSGAADVAFEPGDSRPALDASRLRATGFAAATDLETSVSRYLEWLRGADDFLLRP